MTETEPTDRDAELRRALVATSNAAPYARRRVGRRTVIAAICAFALAGAATGGAVSAVASSGDPSIVSSAAATARNILAQNSGALVGDPFVVSGSGRRTVDLGRMPAGASTLVAVFTCLDPGSFTQRLDGKITETDSCSKDITGAPSTAGYVAGGPGGAHVPPVAAGEHSYRVDSPSYARYSVWLSWASVPVVQQSPAQRAALADGNVTRDEYIAGYNRYSGCMSALGHPIGTVPESAVEISYAIADEGVNSGADATCYRREFAAVDTGWQIEVEQTPIAVASMTDCLVRLHQVPGATPELMIHQLDTVSLGLVTCPWKG
jgi:hypothetical protein